MLFEKNIVVTCKQIMTRTSCEKKISRIETSLRALRDNENEGREEFIKYFTKLIKHLFRKHDRPEVERLLSNKNPNLEHNITYFVEELAKNVFDRRCNKEYSSRFRTYQKDIVNKLIKGIRISTGKGRLELAKSLEGAAQNKYDVYKQFTQKQWENILKSVKTNDVVEQIKDSVFTGEEAQLLIDRMIDVQLMLIGCDDEKTQTVLRDLLVNIIQNSDLKSKLTVDQKRQFYELRRMCQQGGETYHEPSLENLQTLLETIVYLFPNGGHHVTVNNINEIINTVRGNTEQIQRYYDTIRGTLWNLVFTNQRQAAEKVSNFINTLSTLWKQIVNPTIVKLSDSIAKKPNTTEYEYLIQIYNLVMLARASLRDAATNKCVNKGAWGRVTDGFFSEWSTNKCDSLAADAIVLDNLVEHMNRHVALTTYQDVKSSVDAMAKSNLFDEIYKILNNDTKGTYSSLKQIFDSKNESRFKTRI